MKDVMIVGGGLAGLSAAYYLGTMRPDVQITVVEKDARFGGKIKTKRVDDFCVELGPDSYLARKYAMTDLIEALGLGDQLVPNATGQSYIYDRGKMHPIPGGSIIGVPTDVLPFVTSTLFTMKGKLEALGDVNRKPYKPDEDVSMGDFFVYHLGQEVVDQLIEPLLSGVYGGSMYELSMDSSFPEIRAMEKKHGNLLKGMLALKMERDTSNVKHESQFRQLLGGLEAVIDALVKQMPPNVQLLSGTSLDKVEDSTSKVEVTTSSTGGTAVCFVDALVLAVDPWAYRQWWGEEEAFFWLTKMEMSSVAIAVMAFDKEKFGHELEGTGFLLTRKTEGLMTACTYISTKWPEAAPEDKVVLRVFLGRPEDDRVETLSEQELIDIAVKEISDVLDIQVTPDWVELVALPFSMPQYKVGHNKNVADWNEYMKEHHPHIYCIGTAFDGVGMPDGVRQAKAVATKLAEQ